MRVLAAVVLALSAASCSVSVSYDGTGYTCTPPDGACPPGFTCSDEGRCVLGGGSAIDAAPPLADASPGDGGGGPDAPPVANVPWWDDRWPYRRLVTVVNPGTGTIPNGFQVRLELDFDTLAEVTNDQDTMHLMHWTEEDSDWYEMPRVVFDLSGPTEEMWFRVEEAIPAGDDVTHYYLYYGNPSPPNARKDPEFVFDAWHPFDGFDNALQINGNALVQGGELVLDPGESARTFATFPPPAAVDVELRMPAWGPRVWAGFQRQNDFLDDEPWMLWITRFTAPNSILTEVLASGAGIDNEIVGPGFAPGNGAHVYSVERLSGRVVFRRDGVEHNRVTLPQTFSTPLQVRLAADGATTAFFGYIRVREAADPMPVVTLGPEEQAP